MTDSLPRRHARAFVVVLAAVAALLVLLAHGCSVSTSGGGQNGSGAFGGPGCLVNHGQCSTNTDCCSRICAAGNCTCMDPGSGCANDDDCCTEWACVNGTCGFGCRADGAHCAEDSECCNGSCFDNVCGPPRCLRAGEVCPGAGCCDGLSCVAAPDAGYRPSRGTCQGGCIRGDAPCGPNSFDPCCSGFLCQDGLCEATCRTAGLACTSDNQCCNGFACRSGACQPCRDAGARCKTDDDCCAGSCISGTCACGTMGQSCTTSTQCCSRLRCTGGACTCNAKGTACTGDSACCDGLTCTDGLCQTLGCFGYGQNCTRNLSQCCDACSDDGHCCVSSGTGCGPSRPCCYATERCVSGTCVSCTGAGATCSSDADCCGGRCQGGTCCVGDRGAFCGTATGLGEVPCCGGHECGPNMTCCQGSGAVCTADSDCCQGTGWGCHGGRCCAMPLPYSSCKADQDCCPGSQCFQVNVGIHACCLPTGASCTTGGTDYCCHGACAAGKCP